MSTKEPGNIFVHILGQGTEKLEELLNDVNEHCKSKVSNG